MRLVGHESSSRERLLNVCRVAELLGISKRGVYRLVARGELAKPVKVGQVSRWLESEVIAWIERAKCKREVER